MSSDPTTARRGSRPSRRTWLIAAVCALAILVVAGFAWGFVSDRRDESDAADVVEQFRDAVNAKDFETACSLLASTAPLRAGAASRCPSRLGQRRRMIAEWAYILPGDLGADVEQRTGKRIRVIVRPKADTIFDAGPVYRFTLVKENGDLRLEHFRGRF